MTTVIQYEDAQAHMQEEMRRAAVWRLQREVRMAQRANKRAEKGTEKPTGKRTGTQGGWLMAIGKALGAGRNGSQVDAESAQDN